jgi:hypothetical protein
MHSVRYAVAIIENVLVPDRMLLLRECGRVGRDCRNANNNCTF